MNVKSLAPFTQGASTMFKIFTVFAITLLVTVHVSIPAFAGTLGGFDFETDTFENVQARLSQAGITSRAEPDLDGTVRLILNSHPFLASWGHLEAIELTFTPSGQLYQLQAAYGDTGDVLTRLARSLREGGFLVNLSGPGTTYQRGPVTVRLLRDPDPFAAHTYLVITNERGGR